MVSNLCDCCDVNCPIYMVDSPTFGSWIPQLIAIESSKLN